MMKQVAIFAALAATLAAGSALADSVASNRIYDAYFLGYEAEPAMDYGGRDIASLHGAICRTFGSITRTERIRGLPAAYEIPFALGLSVVQHEFAGHGGRGREFGLEPRYGFGLDFSGYTSLGKDPRSNEQNILLSAGGTESDSVLANRILRDLYTGDGADGAKIALLLVTKADFSLYCLSTPNPRNHAADFTDAYTNGNDIAYYLTAQQAQRLGGTPAAVWNNEYSIDATDPLLGESYDNVRDAAIWNLADPAFLSAFYGYVADHLISRHSRVKPPAIPLGHKLGLTAGTRAFLGPDEVSRFLDLYLVTQGPLFSIYGRDLKSATDTAYGYGGSVHGLRLANTATLNASADLWQVPEADEALYDGSGWNICAEVETMVFRRAGLSCKLGSKSDGFFPGTPMSSGLYGGAGILFAF